MITTDAVIIGAGPVGLYQVFQLGLLGIDCHVIDALAHPGGQCAELYPAKPIYDIPGVLSTTGQGLVELLTAQIAPFTRTGKAQFHHGQQVATVALQSDGQFELTTTAGQHFSTKTVFIAAGAGAFVPRKLRLDGLDLVEGKQVFYGYPPLAALAGQHVLIQGDDDRALRWALDAMPVAASVTVIHRREVFVAEPALVSAFNAARTQTQTRLRFVACQITALVLLGGTLTGVEVAMPDGTTEILPADTLLASLGLSPKLGPIAEWGLQLERKQLPVDTEKFQTAVPGIFAVGDINTYPGKKKLIVCGFHECVLAAFAAAALIAPDTPQPLQYTTTSSKLHQRLGLV